MSKITDNIKNAGGTSGGGGTFFLGFIMLSIGGYMLLNAIIVRGSFGFGRGLYNIGGFSLTTGMILVPFIFGIGFIFYNGKSIVGWLLTLGSLAALVFGVISSIRLSMRTMTSFELIVIIILTFGGLGFIIRSLKDFSDSDNKAEA